MKHKFILLLFVVGFVIGFFYFGSVKGDDVSQDVIIVPVKAHLIIDDSGYYTSYRNGENVLKLFEEVNRIWESAEIKFVVDEIVVSEVKFETIPRTINGNRNELAGNENFDFSKINVFFVQSLNNINGLALLEINSALIADYTSVNDFRTTAHELGHLLGLRHVSDADRLMARGKNGEFLTSDEISSSRVKALKYVTTS